MYWHSHSAYILDTCYAPEEEREEKRRGGWRKQGVE